MVGEEAAGVVELVGELGEAVGHLFFFFTRFCMLRVLLLLLLLVVVMVVLLGMRWRLYSYFG